MSDYTIVAYELHKIEVYRAILRTAWAALQGDEVYTALADQIKIVDDGLCSTVPPPGLELPTEQQ